MIAGISAVAERLVFVVAMAGACVGAFFLLRAFVLARAGKVSADLSVFKRGTPGIVYFTTPDCVTCKAAQRPALQALQNRLQGGIQVIEVDALDRADLAKRWSVLSVPTTFILDGNGTPREVNHGFASTEKLLVQLKRVG